MKILFLDFDGVLNPFMHFSHTGKFSAVCSGHIRDMLIKEPTLRIVVSSTWRSKGLDSVRAILKNIGIDPTKVIGVTPGPFSEHGLDREHHIEKWLNAHKDVSNFVIIDDMAEIPDLQNKYVITNSYVGCTEADKNKALEILSR